ncbi:hypothetical protein GC101_28140 [Paenibacillus sp. LMG 31459]|uniref:Glycosyl hydrolase family 95 catalytic domain-containing protein n=1 Tax=Paenibacillus phytohabitans TaxID=2654978 RepID=A0ABX1YNV5_9BACL|nr:hypothetical protein [Paenibacillus phytohabitans]NOU82738.1 hypothetical protein [Paenibacillus phytohabitans]
MSLDWLVEDDEGFLVTSPSTSPQHRFRTDNGLHEVTKPSTMDLILILELFDNCSKAAERLDVDQDSTSFHLITGEPATEVKTPSEWQ